MTTDIRTRRLVPTHKNPVHLDFLNDVTEPRLTYRDRHGRPNPGSGAGYKRAETRLARQREIWTDQPGATPTRQQRRRELSRLMKRATI